jgi:predicted component of viral defense system (DUF524 family)
MDRVTLRRRGDNVPATARSDGWSVDAEHEWIVEGCETLVSQVAQAVGRIGQRFSSTLLLLTFRNAVGRYPAGPLGAIHVQSGKWTELHYATMLDDIATWSAALPFQASAPSALPYSRTELEAPDVLYHAFVWLRHALLEQPDASLIGALRSVLRDPHRRMEGVDRVVPVERATRLSPSALEELAYGVRPFQRVDQGRGLGGGNLFPTEIRERCSRPTPDTAENRFVKAFLDTCGFVVEAMRLRAGSLDSAFAMRVRHDCMRMEGVLAPLHRHRLWEDVGAMVYFPASSTVLQRRSDYREILRHHVLLRSSSRALPLSQVEVQQLLEVKDIARLYELWTAFALVDSVTTHKGPPATAARVRDDDLSSKLGPGLVATWPDGTMVAYNATFTDSDGFEGRSWSLTLRPDCCLWSPVTGLHLFDAKFRASASLADEDNTNADARREDLHKMHAYRDAIDQTRSAWVMYPGTTTRTWTPPGGRRPLDGVGAVPVVPGTSPEQLRALVGELLGLPLASMQDGAALVG